MLGYGAMTTRRYVNMRGNRNWTVCAVLFAVVVMVVSQARATGMRIEPVVIETASGSYRFNAEIADSPGTRSRGLMFRKSLGTDQAMLFDFETDQPVMMWMRNTYIPLDMIFIFADGRIYRIEENAKPFSERIIPARALVRAVLEVAAGTARRLAIQPGDRVRHRMFPASAK